MAYLPVRRGVEPSGVIEPSYHYINEVGLTANLGSLGQVLSYQTALANLEMQEGAYNLHQGINELNKKRQENFSLLEKQKKFFDSITVSGILSDYQEQIFNEEIRDLNENPRGNGHLVHMAQFHDKLCREYLSSPLDPELKSQLSDYLRKNAATVASRAFDQENIRIKASAEVDLDTAINKAAYLVSNGINPMSALETLDPVIESIPDSMPWKMDVVRNARQNITVYSGIRTATLNPDLAEANLKRGGIYSDISPQQRLQIEHVISASRKQIDHNRQVSELGALEFELSNRNSVISQAASQFASGEWGFNELQEMKANISRTEYNYLQKILINQQQAAIKEKVKFSQIERDYALTGSYAGLSDSDQRDLFIRKLGSRGWTYNGQAIDENSEFFMQAQSLEAEKFTTTLPVYKMMLKTRILNGTPKQAFDATQAFLRTYGSHRIVMGTDDRITQAMLTTALEIVDGVPVAEAQKHGKLTLAPLSSAENDELSRNFNGDISKRILPVFEISKFKEFGINIDEDDIALVNYAKKTAEKYYKASRGNERLSFMQAALDITNSRRPYSVNGPYSPPMLGSPDMFISSTAFYDPRQLRVAFNRSAAEECRRIMSDPAALEFNMNIVELREDATKEFNECVIHTPFGKSNGYYWYEPISGYPMMYHVKYSSNKSLSGGYYIRDPVTFSPLTIKLDNLDYKPHPYKGDNGNKTNR
jgi:hypothetical protein